MTTGTASSEQAALAYLRTSTGEPWRWTEHGTVLTWTADGGTVVFRDELLAILEWFAPHGLPAFPALATLLAACRGRTMALDDLLGPAEPVVDLRSVPAAEWAAKKAAVRQPFRLRCQGVLDALGGLEGWPRDLLAGTRAKAMLAEAVFERTEAWIYSPEQARSIIAGLRYAPFSDKALNPAISRRPRELAAKLQALAGLESVDPAALIRRLDTGLEESIAPAPLPPEVFRPPAELARQLLDQLAHDPVHAGLARAARDLLAALSLPRRLPEPDDAATGGVADVANRGSLDKLLLSELANDDLTLAVRVALNEALYLRNEPPAAAKAVSLALLLDAGVRTWGVPRLFVAAAALALGAADARRPSLQTWRANGTLIEPVDLLSGAGFQLGLGALASEAHPGAALPAFFAALDPGESRGAETEAIILTHRDTLADAGFRRALDGLRVPIGVELLVATVGRDGRFELQAYPPGGKPPVCAATIRLDEIQRATDKSAKGAARSLPPAPLLGPHSPTNLPVILSLPRLPFLLPVHGELSSSHVSSDGRTYAVSRSRCLLAWKDVRQGAATLAAGLPPGRTLMLQSEGDAGRIHVLKDQRHAGCIPLATYDPTTGGLRTVRLAVSKSPPLAARMQDGALLLFYVDRTDMFRLEDGEALSSVEAPEGTCWRSGRYYRRYAGEGPRWYHAAWNGLEGGFHPIHGDVGSACAVFDRTGRPGPWMLTDRGEVCHIESGSSIFSLGKPVNTNGWVSVSRDGHHLYLSSKQAGHMVCIDLKNNRAHERPFDVKLTTGFAGEPYLTRPAYPIMNRFVAACALPSGDLALQSRRGWWWQLARHKTGQCGFERLPAREDAGLQSRARPFVRTAHPPGARYRLKEARWPAGSRALLDSRGLLHLKFHGSSTECSLVLTSAQSALWVNDGRMAGARFFLGPDQPKTEVDDLLAILRPLCERLR